MSEHTGRYAKLPIREPVDIEDLVREVADQAGFQAFDHQVINHTVNNLGIPDLELVVAELKAPA